jgi:hypothetical protein
MPEVKLVLSWLPNTRQYINVHVEINALQAVLDGKVRVARCSIFTPKIPIWVFLKGP